MSITLSTSTALDLHLRGSVGSFKVGSNEGAESLEVKYFLTHVGLDLSSGQDEKLLKELAPVREIFDVNNLEFDEIMQRDIDDARVSSDMIPYILDNRNTGLVKFFPPIVVMCMPVEKDRNKPSSYYPPVASGPVHHTKNGVDEWQETRSGKIGSEVFKFSQPILDGAPGQHDLVEFSVNTSKCRLVIVDGQHRAMALLALYRNLKEEWHDLRRSPYKSYYEEWTREYVSGFKLSEIQLPMIICTVPGLDENYDGDYDLKKACRSIFLTLNKNARKVSTTRNLLLNDNDLISSFMRRTLSEIKSKNFRSDTALAIHCVELDQDGDKQKINNELAETGVSHIYYMIEHLMLNEHGISGVSPRTGRYSARVTNSSIEACLDRLRCFDILGQEARHSIRRDLFDSEEISALENEFYSNFGVYIVDMFSKFSVFEASNKSALALKSEVESHQNNLLKPMLFDGQGMIRTFEKHKDNLRKKLDEGDFGSNAPRVEEMVSRLNVTSSTLDKFIGKFKKNRLENLLSRIPTSQYHEGDEVFPALQKVIDKMYGNIFTTVAFQCALISTFFDILDKCDEPVNDALRKQLFDDFLEKVGAFFIPNSISKLKKLIGVFEGRVTGNSVSDFQISEGSADSFRKVVYPAEMQPDAWPAYRYLFLELWGQVETNPLSDVVKQEVEFCRKQIAGNLYKRMRNMYLKDNNLLEDQLSDASKAEVKQNAFKNYKGLISNLEGVTVSVLDHQWFQV